MRARIFLPALLGAFLMPAVAPQAASAQEEARPYVLAHYFQCSESGHARASEIIHDVWGPMAQKRVDAGMISAWGMIVHRSGGPWQRAIYSVSDDRAALRDAVDEMVGEFVSEHADEWAEFNDLCPSHEDYMWRRITGSGPAADLGEARPKVALSTYWVCDENHEALADLLLKEVYGSALDAEVEAGHVSSWIWMGHFLGGEYRRLLVVDGADPEALLVARGNVIRAAAEENGELAGEFAAVCNGHSDYLWDVEISQP